MRLLRDAVRDGHLPGRFDGAAPNMLASVTLRDFENYADQINHIDFKRIAYEWKKYHSVHVARPSSQWIRQTLAQLRASGVIIRNEGQDLSSQMLKQWIGAVREWRDEVIDVIAKYDSADSEQFKILDAVPLPRVSFQAINEKHAKHFREHDYRLVKLDSLIETYRN
jgi:hypothetical protein